MSLVKELYREKYSSPEWNFGEILIRLYFKKSVLSAILPPEIRAQAVPC